LINNNIWEEKEFFKKHIETQFTPPNFSCFLNLHTVVTPVDSFTGQQWWKHEIVKEMEATKLSLRVSNL
jgi:hypothetical protein